jgi:preprotein translocase subunit SecY
MRELLELLTWANQQQASTVTDERLQAIVKVLQAQSQAIDKLANPTMELIQTAIFFAAFLALAVVVVIYVNRLERRVAGLEKGLLLDKADLH